MNTKAQEKEKEYRDYWIKVGENANSLLKQGKLDLKTWSDIQWAVLEALKPYRNARITGI